MTLSLPAHTERLTLRRFHDADLAALHAYRNDPQVARLQTFQDISLPDLRIMIRDMQTAEVLKGLQIAVALRGSDLLIGDLYLHGYLPEQATIGYTFAREQHGHGYASEAARWLLGICFGELHLHRVMAVCSVQNTRSMRLLERIGMRREGLTRSSFRYQGEWHDEYEYAMLADEWRQST